MLGGNYIYAVRTRHVYKPFVKTEFLTQSTSHSDSDFDLGMGGTGLGSRRSHNLINTFALANGPRVNDQFCLIKIKIRRCNGTDMRAWPPRLLSGTTRITTYTYRNFGGHIEFLLPVIHHIHIQGGAIVEHIVPIFDFSKLS